MSVKQEQWGCLVSDRHMGPRYGGHHEHLGQGAAPRTHTLEKKDDIFQLQRRMLWS